jgi:hypothetical protein
MGKGRVIEPGQIWLERANNGLWGLLVLEACKPKDGAKAWRTLVLWDYMESQTEGACEITTEDFLREDHVRLL